MDGALEVPRLDFRWSFPALVTEEAHLLPVASQLQVQKIPAPKTRNSSALEPVVAEAEDVIVPPAHGGEVPTPLNQD